nr:hypothetical protein CFP56_76541 [Quercus suber]
MSNHRKHGEQVRWKERLPEVSNSEKEQNAREGLNGGRTNLVRTEWNGTEVGQQVVSKEFGPNISGAGNLSLIKIKETEDLSGEKKNGPDLNENEGLKSIRPETKNTLMWTGHSHIVQTELSPKKQKEGLKK